ncbi:MAG: DUF2628 domain-containing protein [Oricola sp.]
MASYVVLERSPVAGERPETAFVRDGFSVLALVFPLVWLVWHRLWFAAVMLLFVSAAIGMAGEYLAPGPALALAGLAVSLYVALEGPSWRMARYRRAGFVDAGTVIARNLDDAEIRWFSGRAGSGGPRPAGAAMKPARVPPPLAPSSDVMFGFGAEPGR